MWQYVKTLKLLKNLPENVCIFFETERYFIKISKNFHSTVTKLFWLLKVIFIILANPLYFLILNHYYFDYHRSFFFIITGFSFPITAALYVYLGNCVKRLNRKSICCQLGQIIKKIQECRNTKVKDQVRWELKYHIELKKEIDI